MPLVVITGLPSSGKTHRANQILADFQSRVSEAASSLSRNNPKSVTVQHLHSFHASHDPLDASSQSTGLADISTNPRDVIYNSARDEKTARAEEFSAIKRALSKHNVVIADGPNYIKGFRYQLWCEAKAVGTRCVVVHVAAREDECEAWNEERLKSWGWQELLATQTIDQSINNRPKVGGSIAGHLQPESHTALYGDRAPDASLGQGTRSRSSSMGGGFSDDEGKDKTDIMTLKSLYISGSKPGQGVDNVDVLASNSQQSMVHQLQVDLPTAVMNTISTEPPSALQSLPYRSETLRSLSMRYEPPSPFTRWDTPLFTVPSADPHPPYQAIWDAIFPPPAKPTKKTLSQLRSDGQAETKPAEVRRHAATVLPKATDADALQILESTTADLVKLLLSTARDSGVANGEGGSVDITVPDPKTNSEIAVAVDIPLNTMLTQPALQRLRRKYTQIQRGGIAHGQGYVSGRAEIVKDFVRFLETEWNTD